MFGKHSVSMATLFFSVLFLCILPLQGNDLAFTNDPVGIVLGSSVNVRMSHNLKSKVVGQVKEGQLVEIFQQTKKRQKIGTLDDFWIKIKTPSGKMGYLYGAYLFDLSTLFDNKGWAQDVCSSWGNSITFRKNKTFISSSFSVNTDTGKEEKTKENGKFTVSGRKLRLSNGKEFYLFRHMRINYLTKEKLSIKTKNFSTYCNEQWKSR